MLLTVLTLEQERDRKNSRYNAKGFNVRGSDGKIYRILWIEDCNNVLADLEQEGGCRALGCNPDDWGEDDKYKYRSRFIAQKVFLECDAPAFVRASCVLRPTYDAEMRWLEMGDYGGKI